MTDLNYYFDWYRFTNESMIRFARMKLTGSDRIYWTLIERVHETWDFHKDLGGNKIET